MASVRNTGSRVEAVSGALAEAWRHRSFVWLLVSRFFILMTVGTIDAEAKFFLERSLGYSNEEAATAILILLGLTVLTAALVAVWAGRASDRFGRRRMIWLGCLIGAAGAAALALVPAQPELVVGAVRFPLGGLAAIPIGVARSAPTVKRSFCKRSKISPTSGSLFKARAWPSTELSSSTSP